MQLTRCPVCHARISLDALVQDEAGREMLGILAKMDTETATSTVAYIGLFRSPSRDLANGKALMLIKEVMALTPSNAALMLTVDNLRNSPNGLPIKNHNYLKKVIESSSNIASSHINEVGRVNSNQKNMSKSMGAIYELGEWARGK